MSFFDPTGNGFDIGDLGILVTVIAAIAGLLIAVGRWLCRQIREVVRDEIGQATSLIQPTSNGGKSLPDIANRLEQVERVVMELARRSGIE